VCRTEADSEFVEIVSVDFGEAESEGSRDRIGVTDRRMFAPNRFRVPGTPTLDAKRSRDGAWTTGAGRLRERSDNATAAVCFTAGSFGGGLETAEMSYLSCFTLTQTRVDIGRDRSTGYPGRQTAMPAGTGDSSPFESRIIRSHLPVSAAIPCNGQSGIGQQGVFRLPRRSENPKVNAEPRRQFRKRGLRTWIVFNAVGSAC